MKILRNCWYAAAWADEIVQGSLLPRRIADEPIVFYRKQDGQIAAIADYCPHRFAPLHRGSQVGDVIQCGYHGLQFDSAGKCVKNPHEQGNLPKASIPPYSVVDKFAVTWIWIGDEVADPSLIPEEFAFLGDPARSHVRGRFHVKANYLLMLDNLMDISHAIYLHGDALMTEDLYANFDPKTSVDGDTVIVTLEQKSVEAPGLFKPALPPGTVKTDFYDYVKGIVPANVSHDIAYCQVGTEPYLPTGASSRSAHLFTPETSTSTHYMFNNSRDFFIGDPTTDQRMLGALKKAFGEEDIPMIEAQQLVIGDRDLFDLKPAILVNDRAGVLARRNLAKYIRESEKAKSDATLQVSAEPMAAA